MVGIEKQSYLYSKNNKTLKKYYALGSSRSSTQAASNSQLQTSEQSLSAVENSVNNEEPEDINGNDQLSGVVDPIVQTIIPAVPLDIASTPQQDPVQPKNRQFPSTMFGNKERCFNPNWYSKYSWLEYSVSNNACFCYPCRLFAHGSSKAEDRFVSRGYSDWKHATGNRGGFQKHDISKYHQVALMNWSQYKVTVSSGMSVATRLDNARKEQITKNRHYLLSLIHALMFCATQEIALRGHRENTSSNNKGNFLELVDLLAIYDPILNDRLTNGPQNAQYTSHGIQNQLLHLLGEKLRNTICRLVRSAGVFSILADETKDSAKQEQMSFVIRFADMSKGEIHEHFVTYVEAKSLDATSLSSYIKDLLTKLDLDCSKIVSQGYDGASVMSGRCAGVQAKVRDFAPKAIYVHCYAHVLNLVLVDSCRSVSTASEFFSLMEALYVFMATSKAHVIFVEIQKKEHPDKQPLELQKLSDTRWACRYASINAICRTYDCLLLTLEAISTSSDHSKAVVAKGLLYQIKSFTFIISLVMFDRILPCTKQLSDQLQSSTVDLSRASDLVSATTNMLHHFRTDDYWTQVYTYATDIAKLHSIPVESDDPNPRKRRRPAHLDDSVITESVGFREPTTTSCHFKTKVYFPVLDHFHVEMNERFNRSNILVLKGVSSCSPSSSTFLSFQEMKPFCLMYGIDVSTLEVEVGLLSRVDELGNLANTADFGCYLHSCLPAYHTIYQAVQIALTIAVTSAECERSFSSLKRIKTRLRTTMGEERLSDLAILSIERELASKFFNYDEIIDDFASTDNNRRIVLT